MLTYNAKFSTEFLNTVSFTKSVLEVSKQVGSAGWSDSL